MDYPRVSILMGSQSDLSVMKSCFEALDELTITYNVRILSAHRTPDALVSYLEEEVTNGVKVFIGAAGCAAHLAGVIAAHTVCPVIGVPLSAGALQGMDALLSTVQMPKGIPVATVAIGKAGAINAAHLAAQILGLEDDIIRERIINYRKKAAKKILETKIDV